MYIFHSRRQKKFDRISERFQCSAVLQSIEQMIHYATVSCAQRFYAIKKNRGEKEKKKTSKVH